MKTKIMVDVQGAVELLSYDDEEKKVRYFHDDGKTRYFVKNEFNEYDDEKIQEYLEKYFEDDSAGELFEDVEDVYEWLDVDGVDVIILGEIEWKED